jgi:hypothetical protein
MQQLMLLTEIAKQPLLQVTKYYKMSGARIIRLSAPSSMPQAVSFEEAFGEFSNAQGRGRERRKNRRLDRIENRTEVRSERQQGRGERKLSRQEKVASRNLLRGERTAGREELQMARKGKRLSKRETGLESRLARREGRTASRVGRRDLRNPQAVPSTESAGYVPGVGSLTPGDAGSQVPASTASAGYAPSGAPGTQSGGYAPGTQSGGYTPGTQSGYYEDEETPTGTASGYYSENEDVYDQGLVDETAQNAYDMGYQDAQEDAGLDVEITGDEDYGDFDGVMGAEDRYNELQDKNDMPVNPQIQSIADKCVWNEMLIAKLKNDRKNAPSNPQAISKTILERAKRMKDLKSELENYANYCGAYSSAEGTNEMIAQRKRIVQVAMNKARRKSSGQPPINLTSVPRNLKPQVSANRIVVPSSEMMSSATGTGIDALDDINDYDAPATREFFIPADGGFAKGIDLGSIALGALITVGFIYFNNKYKWIKK